MRTVPTGPSAQALLQQVSPLILQEFSKYVGAELGLAYPSERWGDLVRSISAMARDNHYASAEQCMSSMLAHPAQQADIDLLARYLSIGETYFFRDPRMFSLLEQEILLPLIDRRRAQGNRRLRIWSAGCCTGEETYTLAILVDRLLADAGEWDISILGSDINPLFLRKAQAGLYKEWSFRDVPQWIKQTCFTRQKDGCYAILPKLKRHVSFENVNLASTGYLPHVVPNSLDVILCRNVLMYFEAAQYRKAIANLRTALSEGGWLALSPIEGGQHLSGQFVAEAFPGATFYCKREGSSKLPQIPPPDWQQAQPPSVTVSPAPSLPRPKPDARLSPQAHWTSPPAPEEADTPYERAQQCYRQGEYRAAADFLLAQGHGDLRCLTLLAKACANCGELQEAHRWVEQAIAIDKCDAKLRYLMAVIQEEQGDDAGATRSLQHALYLDPQFALAHFSLGGLSLRSGKPKDAKRQYNCVLALLAQASCDDIVPESDGLSVARLVQIVRDKESRL